MDREHPALVKLMNLAHELWDDGLEQSNKIIVECCEELSQSLESVRSEALKEAERVCELRIREDEKCGRMQARSIIGRCILAIRAFSPARVAEEKDVHENELRK